MASFRVPGVDDPSIQPTALAAAVPEVAAGRSIRVEAGRASGTFADISTEFAEVELTGGARLWTSAEQLGTDFGTRGARDGGSPVLSVVLPSARRSRDGGDSLAIQAIRTFEVQIAGAIADFIRTRVENGKERGGRLQQCVTPTAAAFATPKRLNGTAPVLVFLHGTASSTEGSFGGLWEAVGANRILRIDNPGARINHLFEFYDGRVLAFEHRSLSESPIVNAAALAAQLADVVPGNAELHLVSHSRGGLIGELLCRGMRQKAAPFDRFDLDLFADENRRSDLAGLRALGRVLAEQRYRISRFVRVACPAAGTTLADGRLDRYVSMLVNVAGKVTGLAADPTYKALTSLLAAVLKERTRPESLPGLEAMMPVSPLSQLVNRADVVTSADLHVLGGDLAIRGLWSALGALATDFYYQEDHDLVVNTPSMLRGTPRSQPVKYWIDTDGDVTHFNYFHRADTARRLEDVLTSGKADFHELEALPHEVAADSYQKRDGARLPLLFVLPGFMGSHLLVNGERIWADTARLARGGFKTLAEARSPEPDALVGAYAGLVQYLSATHDVVPFPYDWRLSAQENGARLARAIEQRIDDADAPQPIRILTHGAGGLVFEAMLSDPRGRAVWTRVCAHPAARAVLLGHPFGGAAAADLALLGRGPLIEGLAAIDLVHDAADLRAMFARFPGVRELAIASDTGKSAARRAAASTPFDPARVAIVVGSAAATPVALRIENGEPVLDTTSDGDGYARWEAIPELLRRQVQVAAVDHGGLVTAEEMRAAIVELLTTGRSPRLGALATAPSRGVTERGLPLRKLPMVPGDAELVAAGLGVQPPRRAPRRTPKVRVRVVHGNLSRASSPVVVGHYAQDVFANAEAYLDRQLNGRLRHRHEMRRYPEAIGAVAVEVQSEDAPTGEHPGAIVVGLGVVGELTPGSLMQTLEEGLTAYGADLAAARIQSRQAREARDAEGEAEASSLPAANADPLLSTPVTSLLVGSGEAGLSLRDCLHALLRGIQGANTRLEAPTIAARAAKEPPPLLRSRIETVDVMELFEDRAVEALRTLMVLSRDVEFAEYFEMAPVLVIGEEGRQRVSFEEQATWWQRLRVTEQDASIDPKFPTRRMVLKFEAYSDRARIDAFAVNSQRELANAFIGDAMATTAANEKLGRALFEMLVPNAIKERAPDRRDTVLLLDAAAAAVPWELLEDGLQRDRRAPRPMAIQAGLIRQLVDEHGRAQARPATGQGALVIGNPPVADSRFSPLPGAEEEARIVAAQLGEHERYAVRALIGGETTPTAILAALHEGPWRILHLAVHGVFDFPAVAESDRAREEPTEGPSRTVTGAVIGRHVYLEPADFNQMRYVPELVFLNCCHGGNTTGDLHTPRYPDLAANLATQFIRMGARAVVAAGWAVDDAAAQAFAQALYAELLNGEPFGNACATARREIHRRFPHVNTWGAYQCYGDPEFSLRRDGDGNESRALLCGRELIVEAEALASWAKVADDPEIPLVRQRLDTLVSGANEAWLRDARVLAALGLAYGELREFNLAIHYLTRANQAPKATLSLAALEQLANFQGRLAEHTWRDTPPKQRTRALRKEVDALFDGAKHRLTQLVALSPESAECHSLLGGLEKRRAMTLQGALMKKALGETARHYREAYRLKDEQRAADAFYPFSNLVVASLGQSWLAGTARGRGNAAAALSADVTTLRNLRREKEKTNATDYWSLIFLAESALLEALDAGTYVANRRPLLAAYRRAQRRGGSRRELDSAVTQIRCLALIASQSPRPADRKAMAFLDQFAAEVAKG